VESLNFNIPTKDSNAAIPIIRNIYYFRLKMLFKSNLFHNDHEYIKYKINNELTEIYHLQRLLDIIEEKVSSKKCDKEYISIMSKIEDLFLKVTNVKKELENLPELYHIREEIKNELNYIKKDMVNPCIAHFDPPSIRKKVDDITNSLNHLTKELGQSIGLIDIHRIMEQGKYLKKSIRELLSDYEEDIRTFSHMINDSDIKEKDIQTFLENHPYFFGTNYLRIEPHKRSGETNIIDFRLIKNDGSFDLLELKLPTVKLFIGDKKNKSHKLNRAIEQMQEYVKWYQMHGDYNNTVEEQTFNRPNGILVIGRYRKDERDRILEENASLINIEILTYDDLLQRGRQLIELIKMKG